MVTLCLAGPEAEREFCGHISDGSDASIMKWPASISRAVSQTRCNPWPKLARYSDAAQRLVRSAWARHRIRLLADALLRHSTLSGEQIFELAA
jgi:hypothetical protein